MLLSQIQEEALFNPVPEQKCVASGDPRPRPCKLHRAGALALMGWYLIVPPYVWPYSQRDLRVPLSRWKIVDRFDTATSCEGYLQEMKDDPEAEGLRKMGEMGIGLFALLHGASSPISAPQMKGRL